MKDTLIGWMPCDAGEFLLCSLGGLMIRTFHRRRITVRGGRPRGQVAHPDGGSPQYLRKSEVDVREERTSTSTLRASTTL